MRDNAVHDAYNGATDFKPDSNDKTKSYPLTYNEAGSLVSDAGRKIAKIQYDSNNNPVRIQFTNGNVTKYVYSATGEKLRVIYQTSVYPENAEIVAIGKTKELTKEETKCTETVDYLLGGALTLRNGVIDKYQFEEGYCQATPLYWEGKPFAETFTFCYYDQDHLGNIRQVTMDDGSKKGEVIQRMNYYPFGAEFCDNSTKSYVQNHKYNGKEFDHMHGLNTYDYGARQYNPVTARWDRMDPLSEKYYSTSPYAYCNNNPVKYIDPDGKEILDMLPAQTLTHAMGKHNFFNRWHDNSNSIILMGHGGDNGKSFCTVNDPIVDKIFANSSYGMEYFLEDNTKTWNLGSIASEKVELVLFSCETGSDDGLAENLSKQDGFQDISIFAPSESVCIHSDGSVSIDNHGVWREYRNGEVVNEYSGNTVPGTQEFNSSNFWEKTPQFWQK